MYKIKKSYDVPQMELPKCMYRVKPLNVGNINTPMAVSGEQTNHHPIVNGNPDSTRKPQESSPSVTNKGAAKNKRSRSRSPSAKSKTSGNTTMQMDTSEDRVTNIKKSNLDQSMILGLEARQNEIIKKLTSLRDTLNTMNDQFCQNSTTTAGTNANGIRKSVDVVVNADPEKPPYSVLFLVKLLQENYGSSVALRTHVHSSWHNQLPTQLQKLFNQTPASAPSTGETITITVIWKKVVDKEAQLIVDPSKQAPIRGEANVARFLSRLLPAVSSINYDSLNWDDIVKVDSLIEKAGDLTDLKILENQLTPSSQFLFGDANIADFVCFSKVVPCIITNKVKPGQFPRVFQWLAACQQLGRFHLSL